MSLTPNYKNEPTLWLRLISQNPTTAISFNNLAAFLAPSDISIALFEKAVEIDPRSSLAYKNLGKEFQRKGLFEKAVHSYLQAMAVSQEVGMQISCCYFIGEIYLGQNKLKEAAFYLEKIIPILKGPEYQKQKRLFIEMKIFDPASEVSIVNTLGVTYLRSKRNLEAVEVFQYAVSLDPGNVESHQGLGVAYMNLGETQKALSAFQETVRLAPKNEAVRKNLEIVQTILKKKTAKN
ncbi:MAG: tetratricopeptide repeat protein [Candidatus Omnitrophota bacterium]